MKAYKPVALIILDGWGIREKEHGNAVAQAKTPNYDRWLRELERSIVDASGEAVGLPDGQMGNSEAVSYTHLDVYKRQTDSRADGGNDPSALVAGHNRRRVARRPGHQVPVAVTNAGRGHAHQHLTRSWRGQVERFDGERHARFMEDSGFDFQLSVLTQSTGCGAWRAESSRSHQCGT